MKTLFRLVFLCLFTSVSLMAQTPQKFSYQTVIRNGSNQLLSNQQVGIKISVLQGSETGIVVYSERHTPSTNANGLATLSIGTGSVLSGIFQNINWASGSYYIQTETDPNGGNNYTIISTQQLLSVPYALYAETSGSSTPGPQGEQGPVGQTGPQGPQGLTGATGPAGSTGPSGATGPQGAQGLTGTAGATGPIGLTGVAGSTGPQGSQGLQGAAGTIGATGPTGATGATGAAGSNGKNSLVKTTNEPAGATCISGGVKMEYGIDANSNGTLDLSEVNNTLTKYVCNGVVGSQGPQGPAGQNGATGPQGPIGPQGNPATDDQQISVSATGDTLFIQGGGFVVIPGLSGANFGGNEFHSCGVDEIHNPNKAYGTILDQQGNSYKTILIGNQEWMAENLKTTTYQDGSLIQNITDGIVWGNTTVGAWCDLNNNPNFDCPYGKYYNWYAVTDPKEICPLGWRVPSIDDWYSLFEYLNPAYNFEQQEQFVGPSLKSTISLWNSPNNSTNESGFSALPSGYRQSNYFSTSNSAGTDTFFWTNSLDQSNNVLGLYMNNSVSYINISALGKNNGISVRCIRN